MSIFDEFRHSERKTSDYYPQSARNTQYPQQMYGENQSSQNFYRTQLIQNETALNQNNYHTNYIQRNYSNNDYPNYNNNYPNYNNNNPNYNYNPQQPQNQITQSFHSNNSYQNTALNSTNSQYISQYNNIYHYEENYNNGFNIYYFNNKDNIINESYFFDKSLNIYSLSEIIKNNRNMNYNSNSNMSNNMNNNTNIMNNNYMNNSNNNMNNNNNNPNYNMNNNSNYNMNNNINNYQKNNNMNNNQNNNNLNNNQKNYMNNAPNYNLNNNMNNNQNKMNNCQNNINYSNNTNNFMNHNNMNNNMDYNNGSFRCDKCSRSHCGLKRIKNICPDCFMIEILNQSKNVYIEYLKQVTKLERANTITRNDLENLFLQKIIINLYNNQYNIYDAAFEFNFPENENFNVNQKIDEIIFELKKSICCYCYCNVQSNEFKLPCGCNFCTYEHLSSFFSQKVKNKLTYNYKCFCSYQYGPNKVLELCNFFKNKNIFKDYECLLKQLNHLFGEICFKCGREKTETELQDVDIEGFCPIKFEHSICKECIQKEESNYIECIICEIQHKYLLKDF